MSRYSISPWLFACLLSSSSALLSAAEATPEGAARLLRAYPQQLCKYENNTLIWCDGRRMRYDDGITAKNHEQKLASADLQEQMEQPYTAGETAAPKLNQEPGRIRNEDFFKAMYGTTSAEVKAKLAPVVWLRKHGGETLMVTSVNQVDRKLQAISDELDQLPDHLRRYVDNPAGTFNWRVIAGETRLSPHSFATAVDINVATGNYWRWDNPKQVHGYKNQVPWEIVRIFEKHGFIWGGKWYHYDTLHFEYRPELLLE